MNQGSFTLWSNLFLVAIAGASAPSNAPDEIVRHCAAIADRGLRELTARWPDEVRAGVSAASDMFDSTV